MYFYMNTMKNKKFTGLSDLYNVKFENSSTSTKIVSYEKMHVYYTRN